MEMPMDFEILCRLCMMKTESMIFLFSERCSLPNKIMSLFPELKVYEGDDLPSQVCHGCADQINNFFNFKLQCEHSNITFNKYLVEHKTLDAARTPVPEEYLDASMHVEEDPAVETMLDVSGKEEIKEEEPKCDDSKSTVPNINDTESKNDPPVKQSVSSKVKTTQCHICNKQVVCKRLNEHMRRHLGGRPFGCEECGKTFGERSSLKKHSLVHSGQKVHMCDICGRSFKLLNQLKAHHVTHTGQKSHVCDVCGKRFSHVGSFRIHELLHSGEKPFNCDICGNGYSQKNSLLIHLAVHSGQRQHVCEICGKGFLLKGHLQRHFVVHSGEKKFSCDVCGASYTQRHSLKKHALKHDSS